VPSFFVLSGFLVAGSLMRAKSIFEFGMLRALRIVPALFVETVIAAFILGPLFTELPLRRYFSDAAFWHYPLNIIGDIHYVLPGVFIHNPIPNIVNVQLWTIPAELLCYVTLVVAYLAVVLISRLWHLKLKTGLGLLTLCTLLVLLASMMQTNGSPKDWHAGAETVATTTLLLSFLIGVASFFYREHIPLRLDLLLLSLAAAYIGMYGGRWQYLAVIPLAYATIYTGLTSFPRTLITATGDYSYGIYLYGYPVQQTFACLFPHNRMWELNFIVSLATAMMFAAFSWHFVESRVLAKRKVIIEMAQAALLGLLPLRRSETRTRDPLS
jgi:peptidoglycan/LPS O-acetylase OafA/YrhL